MWDKEAAEKLLQLRKEKRLSLRGLHSLTTSEGWPIQVAQLGRLECGSATPRVNDLIVLCKILGVDWDYFLNNSPGRPIKSGVHFTSDEAGFRIETSDVRILIERK